jgi:hypothetical protein
MMRLLLLLVVTTIPALAQSSDVLGVHNCYGRGCVACHTPHSGASGNGRVPAVVARLSGDRI